MALERLLATVALSTISVLALSGCVTIMPSALAPVAEGSVPQERDDDFGTVDVYTVLDDGTLDPAASGLTATVWETFTRVATVDFAAEVMTQYRVGDSASSDTLAYVYQDDDPVLRHHLGGEVDRGDARERLPDRSPSPDAAGSRVPSSSTV